MQSQIFLNMSEPQRYREVARIGQDINHELSDIDSLFEKLKNHISVLFDDGSALLLAVYQPQSRKLDIYQAEKGRQFVDANLSFEGACRYVIETRQPLFIHQRSKEAEDLGFRIVIIEGTEPEEAFIFVPLMLRGEPIGVLSIQNPQPNAYTQEDQFILELLANHVALALHNASLYRSLSQLYETGQILTQQFEVTITPQTIVNNIKEATKADLVVLYPFNTASGDFVSSLCIAGTLLDPTPIEAQHSLHSGNLVWMLLEEREPIFAANSEILYTALNSDVSPALHTRFYQREAICSTAAIPLRVEGKAVGVLFANFRQPQRFDTSQRLLIEGLAHYAAIAIRNAQTFEHMAERHIHELETLQKIDKALNMPDPELKTLLNTILYLGHEQVHPDNSSLLLFDTQKLVWTFGAATGPYAPTRMARTFMPLENKGIICWVLHHKQTALVHNVRRDPLWRNIYLSIIGDTISELDVPLLDGDQIIGVLNFESAREGAFSLEDALFLETLAGQAVLAIKKAQAYEREKDFAARFRLLYEAGQELGKITEWHQLETAYETIVQLAQKLSQSPVVIRRYDEENQALMLAYNSWYRHSPPSLKIERNRGLNGKVARELRTLVIDDLDRYPTDELLARPADPTIRSMFITPIVFKDRYYGNLELTHGEIAHFHSTEQEFFEALAMQLASTLYRLEITQERQELEQRAQAAEVMVSMAQSTYEITHRLGNDLGLVGFWVNTIEEELKRLGINSPLIFGMLNYIQDAVGKVMQLSENLRTELRSGEDNNHFILLPPKVLLEDAKQAVPLPNNIHVALEIEDDVGPVHVIHKLIADALRNLVTNAKEAMPQGGELTLRARNAGRSVALEVIDTGVGIVAEHQAKIFDLFFTTKLSSGFGLWSARRNVLKNRGTLEVKSELNKGTTFTLLLPRAEEHFV